MKTIKLYICILLLTLTLSFAAWYYFKPNNDPISTTNYLTRPENIITNMQATIFDANGKPSRILTTPELQNYSDETSILTHPQITIFNESEQPWQIQSLYGLAENSSDKITLWGNVILHQDAGSNHSESTITTSKLIHYPQQGMAETDQAITFQQPGLVVHSIGMRTYLDTKVIDLLAQANGYYEHVE